MESQMKCEYERYYIIMTNADMKDGKRQLIRLIAPESLVQEHQEFFKYFTHERRWEHYNELTLSQLRILAEKYKSIEDYLDKKGLNLETINNDPELEPIGENDEVEMDLCIIKLWFKAVREDWFNKKLVTKRLLSERLEAKGVLVNIINLIIIF
jgi:hypothetical protein